jgi:hypothetical protein
LQYFELSYCRLRRTHGHLPVSGRLRQHQYADTPTFNAFNPEFFATEPILTVEFTPTAPFTPKLVSAFILAPEFKPTFGVR